MNVKILRDLENGLLLRRSSAADADLLADFNAQIHGEDELDRIRLAAWTRDLLAKPHPTFHADDFTVIAEAATGRIVSALNIIPQTWNCVGYRSFEELHHAFADCFWEDNEARVVLNILFPKRLSDVFPVA